MPVRNIEVVKPLITRANYKQMLSDNIDKLILFEDLEMHVDDTDSNNAKVFVDVIAQSKCDNISLRTQHSAVPYITWVDYSVDIDDDKLYRCVSFVHQDRKLLFIANVRLEFGQAIGDMLHYVSADDDGDIVYHRIDKQCLVIRRIL